MTFTTETPTTPGFYACKAFRDDQSFHTLKVSEIDGILTAFYDDDGGWSSQGPINKLTISGWCRLVPAEEVEKAFREGATFGLEGLDEEEAQTIDNAFYASRAKQAAEGKV